MFHLNVGDDNDDI